MTAATALAFSLLVSSAAPPRDRGGTSATAPAAAVELDLRGLEPLDPGVRTELVAAIHRALASTPAELAAAIHVDVAWRDQDDVDYAVHVRIDAHGDRGARELRARTGPDATADALADTIAAAVERALHERPRIEPTAPAQPAETAPTSTPTPARTPVPRRADKPSASGWAGIGIAIAGAASLGVGTALAIVSPTANPRDATRLRDWQYTAYSMIGLGGAAIIAGSAMAIVDVRGRHRTRAVAVRPFMHRRGGGLSLRLRF